MRLALLASLALTSQLHTLTAEACGGDFYRPPQMFVVAAHHGRTFVLLDGNVTAPDTLDWKDVPSSYDMTKIAEAPALPAPRTLTMVGPKGTTTVASNDHVFITPEWQSNHAMNALEVLPSDRTQPRLAIEGEHASVRWTGLESVPVSLDVIAWAEHPGFSPALDGRSLMAEKLDGTELEMITSYANGTATTYFRTGDRTPWGGYAGSPIGAVTVDGVRYVVLVNDGLVTPVRA